MVGGDDSDGFSHLGKFYRSDPHYWWYPDRPADAFPDPMAPAQERQNGPHFHERNADWLWMGINIQVYNWVGHDRPVAHLGLGVTALIF